MPMEATSLPTKLDTMLSKSQLQKWMSTYRRLQDHMDYHFCEHKLTPCQLVAAPKILRNVMNIQLSDTCVFMPNANTCTFYQIANILLLCVLPNISYYFLSSSYSMYIYETVLDFVTPSSFSMNYVTIQLFNWIQFLTTALA